MYKYLLLFTIDFNSNNEKIYIFVVKKKKKKQKSQFTIQKRVIKRSKNRCLFTYKKKRDLEKKENNSRFSPNDQFFILEISKKFQKEENIHTHANISSTETRLLSIKTTGKVLPPEEEERSGRRKRIGAQD